MGTYSRNQAPNPQIEHLHAKRHSLAAVTRCGSSTGHRTVPVPAEIKQRVWYPKASSQHLSGSLHLSGRGTVLGA